MHHKMNTKNTANNLYPLFRAVAGEITLGVVAAVATFPVAVYLGFNAPAMRALAIGTLVICVASSAVALSGIKIFIAWARKSQRHGEGIVALLAVLSAALAIACPFLAFWLMLWPETFWMPGFVNEGYALHRAISILSVAADGWYREAPVWLYQNISLSLLAMPGSFLIFALLSYSVRVFRWATGSILVLLRWSFGSLLVGSATGEPEKES